MPTYKKLRAGVELMAGPAWKEEAGFAIHVVMGETFMNRDQVDKTLRAKNLAKLELLLADGRNISVYYRRREKPEDPLNIFDVPTTLLTSERVIKKVEAFWGGNAEEPFHNSLVRREIASFWRALNEIVKDEQLDDSVELISLIEFKQLP